MLYTSGLTISLHHVIPLLSCSISSLLNLSEPFSPFPISYYFMLSCLFLFNPYSGMWFGIPLAHLTLSSLIHFIFIFIIPSHLISWFLPPQTNFTSYTAVCTGEHSFSRYLSWVYHHTNFVLVYQAHVCPAELCAYVLLICLYFK